MTSSKEYTAVHDIFESPCPSSAILNVNLINLLSLFLPFICISIWRVDDRSNCLCRHSCQRWKIVKLIDKHGRNFLYFGLLLGYRYKTENGLNPGVTYLDWKRSSGWLESWWRHMLPTATLSTDQSNRSPGFLNFQLSNTTTWLWSWLPHRLSKCQSLTTVLLRTPITQMIFFNQDIRQSLKQKKKLE